jgi:hypothetical protein
MMPGKKLTISNPGHSWQIELLLYFLWIPFKINYHFYPQKVEEGDKKLLKEPLINILMAFEMFHTKFRLR